MARVVRNERGRADRGPTLKAAIDDFDSGQNAGKRIGNLIAFQRLRGRRQVARELKCEFGSYRGRSPWRWNSAIARCTPSRLPRPAARPTPR